MHIVLIILLAIFTLIIIAALCKLGSKLSREEEQKELEAMIEEFNKKHKKEE